MARNLYTYTVPSRGGILSAVCITTTILVGCAAPRVFNLSTVPSGPMRANQTFQFVASLNGQPKTTEVMWSVLPAGNPSKTGTVTQTGLYTAPTTLGAPITVNVQAELAGDASAISTMPVQLMPPVPAITAASQNVLIPGSLDLEIGGVNFNSQTTAYLNGTPMTFSYASASTATITGTLSPGVAQASLVLRNPWDPVGSSPFVMAIASSGSGSPSGASGSQGPPPLSTLQSLTGCSNPNTGTSNNDWGVGSDPVYTLINNVTPQVGSPFYTSNTIFWISRETGPGQSVLMTGAFTDATKSVRVAPIPLGTVNWKTLVEKSTTVVPTTQQRTTGLSFIVPSSFPAGVYGFEIDDPSAPPVLGLANAPSMSWAIGVPSATDPSAALQHRVHDCGAEAGEILRIFGKNFAPSSEVIIQSSSGVVYPLAPSKLDANSIAATVPSTLGPGAYYVWVGSYPWSATSSPVSQITIFSPPSLTVTYATCSGLVGDGSTDNTTALQACLDYNAPIAGSDQLVYIAIPQGSYVLTDGVRPRSYEVLVGSSPTSTNFLGRPRGAPPTAWFTVPQYVGMANLSLQAPANPYLLVTSGSTTGSPLTSGHLFFSNVNFQSTSDASGGWEQMFVLAGQDVQVYDSFFRSGSNQAFDVNFGDGGIVSGNRIVLNNRTGLGFGDSQNMIFENNLIYSQNTPGQGDGYSGGSGMGISRMNNQFGPSALSQDIYVGYNTFQNMGSRGQQVITNDGDGGSYYGPIASSTASTVVLADDPAWNWMGTTNPQASSIAIVAGTGLGQYSFLKSYNGRTMNLLSPWKILPDSTSVVAITQYELNMTIAHNTITNTLGTSILLGDALEGVVEDNTMTNSGDGILISAFGPYGGPAAYGPVIDTDVLRNTIGVGAGNYITSSANVNVAGIGIQDMPGCLLSGLLIRGNVVPPTNTIFSTNGANGISANLIEQNQANWIPTSDPGFLVQDNTPQ